MDSILEIINLVSSVQKLLTPSLKEPNKGEISQAYTVLPDILSKLIASQQRELAQVQKIRELENRITQYMDWAEEKQTYVLVKVGRALVYQRKPDFAVAGEPEHYLCTNCYEENRKSIIQFQPMLRKNMCPACDTVFGRLA